MLVSLSSALLAVFGVVIAIIIRRTLAAPSSPLKHIPAPWYAKITDDVLRFYTVTGKRMYYIHSLHRRHGPVIRISPDEVSVADPDAYVAIHRMGSGFNKAGFYQGLVGKGKPGIFTMSDPKQHAARRKLFARAFTTSSIRTNCEALVREKVEVAVERLRAEAVYGNAADVHKWWTLMAIDIVAELSFGESFDMLQLGRKNHFIQVLDAVASASTIRYELPWLHSLLSRLPIKSTQLITNTRGEMMAYSRKAVENLRRNKGNKANLFAAMLAASEADEKSDLSDDVIRGEASNMLIAGSDPVSSSLTYLVWALLKLPGLQRRLEDEVGSLAADFDDSALEELPLLDAVINETLRLYGAVQGTFPRTTPSPGVYLGGYFIPPGTVVNTQTYTMHRLPDIFPNPLKFDETRFLPGAPTETQKLIYSPFGTGTRSCLGISLARMEMRLAVAVLFRKCRGIKLAGTMTDEMMEMVSFIVAKPSGNKCEVVLDA
ncbi:putative sterigmatocystin biosynthesis P450 monooxygenase STCB [Colletotrichum trifolii]|uniref:Putative sterigmatocystin biosynthesis P450 monooxygenase STCB n=1 Tax=Colletotrichum trifolii TaxID=5466 RepID=A0A4R8QWP0_COLTR|nr:putative sterigmatocystin biosynthesis P450 monooxygenase STCB [Colletotrichum trifolii]